MAMAVVLFGGRTGGATNGISTMGEVQDLRFADGQPTEQD